MKKLGLALCVLLTTSSVVYAEATPSGTIQGNVAAGKTKSATCTACHGSDTNPMTLSPQHPNLRGQHAGYIVRQLQAFKSGQRKNENMSPMAAPLSEQDMADLAAYFSSLPKVIEGAEKNPELIAAGEKLYRGGNKEIGLPACIGCHGPQGNGNPLAKFPQLSGQRSEYTLKQLKDFKAGTRGSDTTQAPNLMMRQIASKMSDSDMKAVSEYIAGLH